MSAEFRSVQTRMWREDDWFQDQQTDARLLFIYLFTNPSASVAGIYRLPLRTIVFESGIPAERVHQLLAQFSAENKVHYEDGIVWVVKMRDNQLPGKTLSPKVATHLDGEINKIPACRLKERYLQTYGYPIQDEKYPIDTLSIHDRTETITETITCTETDTNVVVVVGDATTENIAAVFQAWQDNMPGTMTPVISDDLNDLITTYGATNVIRAITEATRANARNLRYVAGILRNQQNGTEKPVARVNGNHSNGNGKQSKIDQTREAFERIQQLANGGATA